MNVNIEIDDEIIFALVDQARRENCSFDEALISRLQSSVTTLESLSDEEIQKKLNEWFKFAIDEYAESDRTFTLQQLVLKFEGPKIWLQYSPATRKQFGKRFKVLVLNNDDVDGCRIATSGKTITNAALYKVVDA